MIIERAKVAEAIVRQLVREPDLEKAVAAVAQLLNLPESVVFECAIAEIGDGP